MTVEYILDTNRGVIEAPAGCGKTHLIVASLKYNTTKPILLLTHTTAGVMALRKRLSMQGIPNNRAVISTIDGWITRMASFFPTSMAINDAAPENRKDYYPFIRQQSISFIGHSPAIRSVISDSYSRLIVDEYQDCDVDQHQLVSYLAGILPTVVLGDPLQAIFTFSSPMPCWEQHVKGFFGVPECALSTPHRWLNAGTGDLGYWLLELRKELLQESSVNLEKIPENVSVLALSSNSQQNIIEQNKLQYSISNSNPHESLLIIGDSKSTKSRHLFAQRANNLDVVEPVDLTDIVQACESFDRLSGKSLIEAFLGFHATLMTGVDMANSLRRINSIANGTSRKPPSPKEALVAQLATNRTTLALMQASRAIVLDEGTHIFRKVAFRAFNQALDLAQQEGMLLRDAILKIRERRRLTGEDRIAHRAVGSTLLLKGLECDHCIVLDANSMNKENFYVAATRAAKSLSIYTRSVNLLFT